MKQLKPIAVISVPNSCDADFQDLKKELSEDYHVIFFGSSEKKELEVKFYKCD